MVFLWVLTHKKGHEQILAKENWGKLFDPMRPKNRTLDRSSEDAVMEKDRLLLSQSVAPSPLFTTLCDMCTMTTRFDTDGITYIPVNSVMSFIIM